MKKSSLFINNAKCIKKSIVPTFHNNFKSIYNYYFMKYRIFFRVQTEEI